VKLVSVNVSLARDVNYKDKVVSTGIFKQASADPVFVHAFGIEGDQQVDLIHHGGEYKAVYGFSAQHYPYWQQQLAKPLRYGQFGENLTITDLDERQLCIGDHLQIGDCQLEITQPRVPCFKLGIALDDSTMPKRFVQYGATGIYFKVISTGEINTGDAVSVTYPHPERVSVFDLFNAYFDKTMTNAKQIMQKAEQVSALSDEWREKVVSRL